jgi:hypothetical protein
MLFQGLAPCPSAPDEFFRLELHGAIDSLEITEGLNAVGGGFERI